MESTFAFKRRVEQTFAITFFAVNFVRFFFSSFYLFFVCFCCFPPISAKCSKFAGTERKRERDDHAAFIWYYNLIVVTQTHTHTLIDLPYMYVCMYVYVYIDFAFIFHKFRNAKLIVHSF